MVSATSCASSSRCGTNESAVCSASQGHAPRRKRTRSSARSSVPGPGNRCSGGGGAPSEGSVMGTWGCAEAEAAGHRGSGAGARPGVVGGPCSWHLSAPMSTNATARAWIELDSNALRENYARLRGAVGEGVGMIPMVKADAYGLGLRDVVERLEPLDPAAYGVATVDEGIALRRLGVRRTVVVCSPAPPGSIPDAL